MANHEFKDIKILIVDDLSSQRALFGKALAKVGFQVRGVSDGIAALDVYEKWPADIILLDVVMDPINGFDVLRKIKAASSALNPYTKVLMCSIKSGKVDELWAKNQGADDYMIKPVSEEKLINMVQGWVYKITSKKSKEQKTATEEKDASLPSGLCHKSSEDQNKEEDQDKDQDKDQEKEKEKEKEKIHNLNGNVS